MESIESKNILLDNTKIEDFKPLEEVKDILNNFNYSTYIKILDILSEKQRCAVVQPTGTGKTYLLISLLKHFKDTQKIVIAPSAEFLSHIKENKFWNFNEKEGNNNKVNTFTYSKLCRNKLQLSLLLDVYKINPNKVSLIVIDELHRIGAEEWSVAINNLVSLCPNAKIVGLTATPKRYKENRNMVNEFFKGTMACNINLADAVELGMLRKLDYVVGISDKYKNSNNLIINNSNNITLNEIASSCYNDYIVSWNFDKYFESTLKKYLDTTRKVGKFIVFVNRVEEAKNIEKFIKTTFNSIFNTNKVKIYQCHTGDKNNCENIKEFFSPHIDEFNSKNQLKADIRVAIAINKLTESYHDKELKAIIMIDRTYSVNGYIQQIGRLFNGISVNEEESATVSKTGNPIVFDFLDSLNSLNKLKEDILSSSLSESDNDSTYNCVFENYYNETSKFEKEINRINALTDVNSTISINFISNVLKKNFENINAYSCIYDLEQYSYIFEYLDELEESNISLSNTKVLERLQEKFERKLTEDEIGILYTVTAFKSNLISTSKGSMKNIFKFNKDILENFDYKTYKLILKLKSTSKGNEADLETKKLISSKFNKALILNRLSDSTLEFFEEIGLKAKITTNKEKLYTMLKKREKKISSVDVSKLLGDSVNGNSDTTCLRTILLYENIETNKYYTIHLHNDKIANYFENHPIVHMSESSMNLCLAYWLWKCINKEHKELLRLIEKEADKYKLYELRILRTCNLSRLSDSMKSVISIDKVLSPFYYLDSIEDITNKEKLKELNILDEIQKNYSDIQLYYIADLLDNHKLSKKDTGLGIIREYVLKSNGIDTIKTEVETLELDLITNKHLDLETVIKLNTKVTKLSARLSEVNNLAKWSEDICDVVEQIREKINNIVQVLAQLEIIKKEEDSLKHELEKNKKNRIAELKSKEQKILTSLKEKDYSAYSEISINKFIQSLDNKIDTCEVSNAVKMLKKSKNYMLESIHSKELALCIEQTSKEIENEIKGLSLIHSKIVSNYPSMSIILAVAKEYSNSSMDLSITDLGSKITTTFKYILHTFLLLSSKRKDNEALTELLNTMLEYTYNLETRNSIKVSTEFLLSGFSIRTANNLIKIYRDYKNGMKLTSLYNKASSLSNAQETDLSLIQDIISLRESNKYSEDLIRYITFLREQLFAFRLVERRERA